MNDWNSIQRMIPIAELGMWKQLLRDNKIPHRIRYRGPHGYCEDTRKANARAFTVYMVK
jgi:hypothetical protein